MIHPINALNEMSQSFGVAKKDLLVLAPANDPFNSGTPTNLVTAKWFAGLLDEHNLPAGKHLRRYYYVLVTLNTPVVMPNGQVFENTDKCWSYLQKASAHARYQGLVDPGQFTDNRNPAAEDFHALPRQEPEPTWEVDDFYDWTLPSISMRSVGAMMLPEITVDGYDYDDGDQPYHLECWIEKSTMDAELDPICEAYSVTKKQGIGFDSVTSVIKMLERCQAFMEMNRPIRIFYISDFDPGGVCMPVAVARQIQFWLWRQGREADIRLKPLVLTPSQVAEYELPRKPIKEEDRRKGNFEKRHGEGHVELDALAALHPGEFERIVSGAFADYRDESLAGELEDVYSEATDNAEQAWADATSEVQEEVDDLLRRVDDVSAKYKPQVDELRSRMDAELASLRTEMDELQSRAADECREAGISLHVDLPIRPSAEPSAEAEDDDWLYDSTRTYGDQLDYFHAHQNGDLE